MSVTLFNTDRPNVVLALTVLGFFTIELDHSDCDDCCELIPEMPLAEMSTDTIGFKWSLSENGHRVTCDMR